MKKISILSLIALVLLTFSCKQKSGDSSAKSIAGAGATFPMPYYNQLFEKYNKDKGILVTYGGIGSGGGIRSLKDKVVDFGATDAFLDDDQMKEMPAAIVHVPTCIGAVVISYNLEGITELNLTSEIIEKIFLGEIKKWNDPQILAINKGAKLPNLAITVVTRSDGSGTTFIFSDYMTKVSEKWAKSLGRGKSLKFIIGIGAKGNPGVAGTIKQTQGAIGYIGSEYAFAQKLPTAAIKNKAGNFVKASIESVSAAANGQLAEDTRTTITDSEAKDAYSISGFTWLIIYKEQNYNGRSQKQAEETLNLINWILSKEAQDIASAVQYSPLPAQAVAKAQAILKSVTYDGKTVLK